MNISLNNLRLQLVHQILDVISVAKQKGNFLQASKIFSVNPSIPLILLGIFYSILLFLNAQWRYLWIFIAIGCILAYFITREFQKLSRLKKLGHNCAFFDQFYFYFVKEIEINIIRLTEYKFSDIVLSPDKKDYIVRFHFNDNTFPQFCSSHNDPNVITFQNNLTAYSNALKQPAENLSIPRLPSITLNDKINSNRYPIIISTISVLILFLLTPKLIDFNQFSNAKEINTATSYRIYLRETKNIRYREISRSKIKELYGKYIQDYSQLAVNSVGSKAFQKVLEYLRDKDLYSVRLIFTSASHISNEHLDGYKLIPITPSFSKEKNSLREDEVFSAIKSSFGKVFPSDIVTLNYENLEDIPILQVHYEYKNKEGSMYYSEQEEYLQDKSRTYYYGINIDWHFQLFIPSQKDPVYEFNLTSEPAPQFNSDLEIPDAIYNSMATSAFYDFVNEFNTTFFDWTL